MMVMVVMMVVMVIMVTAYMVGSCVPAHTDDDIIISSLIIRQIFLFLGTLIPIQYLQTSSTRLFKSTIVGLSRVISTSLT
jgi:hypothetical protein